MAEKKQTGGTGKRAKSEKPAVLSGTVPEWSSTTVISQLLGKTVRRVQQLTQEGVLETEIPPGGGARKYRTCATVQRYVAYVEAKAQETGENSRAAELTLKKLEAEVELKESQGQLHRLKTAIAEGRYLAADHATEELTEFMASFKKFAMNIPPRMAGTMSGYCAMFIRPPYQSHPANVPALQWRHSAHPASFQGSGWCHIPPQLFPHRNTHPGKPRWVCCHTAGG